MPQVGAFPGLSPGSGTVALAGGASDLDGWVKEVKVDWGDGSAPTTWLQDQACVNGDGGRPFDSGSSSGWRACSSSTATPARAPTR